MAAITVSRCNVVKDFQSRDLPVGEAMTEGHYSRLNTTTGKLELGNATTTGELGNTWGLISHANVAIGQTAHLIMEGIVDIGDGLEGLAYDAPVYVNDADGSLGDAAGTVSRIVGRVVPVFSNIAGTAEKLLELRRA